MKVDRLAKWKKLGLLMVLLGCFPLAAIDKNLSSSNIILSTHTEELPSPEADPFFSERKQYQQALEALRSGRVNDFNKLKEQLVNYPLYPYLEQTALLDNLSLANRDAIASFLDEYQNQPVTRILRSRFLYLLARHQQTFLYLTHYRPTADINLQCYWFTFRLKTDESPAAIFDEAKSIWLYGRSRPDSCDPLFAAMKASDFLTDDLIWQRYLLALDQGQAGLMRYLASQLSEPLKKTAFEGIRIYRNLSVPSDNKFAQLSKHHASVITARVAAKKVWSQAEATLAFIDKASSLVDIPPKERQSMAKNIALALATKGHQRASQWLNNLSITENDSTLLRWKLANMLREQKWSEVQEWLEKTPAPKSAANDWLYWKARAAQELGEHERSIGLLRELSTKRSYYGFLAAAKLGQPPSLQQNPFPFDHSVVSELTQHPRTVIAKELWTQEKYLSARREWNYLKTLLDETQQSHLAVVAHNWGWHEQAIFVLAEQGLFDQVDMRFPLAFHEELASASQNAQLDLSLSFAIARRESAFAPNARSRVGARGLMQLMPNTARYIAKKNKLAIPSSKELDDPKVNSVLATHYLRYLLEQYDSNLLFAAASYNAGQRKVEEWIQNNANLPADIWIEVVPYKETRAYIKNVLAYQQIYQTLLGQADTQFQDLIDMNISIGSAK